MNMAVHLRAIQKKIELGFVLTPAEQNFVLKHTTPEGIVSHRKWIGMREFPDSVVDVDEPAPVPNHNGEFDL